MSGSEPANGTDTVKSAVAVFYDRVVADPELARWFEGVDLARLRAHQRAFLIVALGGPEVYSGRGLGDAHAGMEVTDAAFDRTVEHLVLALQEVGMAGGMIDELRYRVAAARALIVTA